MKVTQRGTGYVGKLPSQELDNSGMTEKTTGGHVREIMVHIMEQFKYFAMS